MTAVLFGFWYLGWGTDMLNWPQVIWTMFVGLIFGIVREKSESVIAPTVLHGMMNYGPQAILFIVGPVMNLTQAVADLRCAPMVSGAIFGNSVRSKASLGSNPLRQLRQPSGSLSETDPVDKTSRYGRNERPSSVQF